MPYKRYAADTLLNLSRNYLENDRQSYRQTVQLGTIRFGYQPDSPSSSVIDDRVVSRMTIWRMLTWLSAEAVSGWQ